MLRIRLSRVGKRKQPAYRIVVTDRRNPREGAHLEVIGHFNPLTDPPTVKIKDERAIHWLKVGAMPSDTAARILTKAGLMEQAGREPFVYVGKQVPKGQKNPKKARKEAEEGGAPAAAVASAPAAKVKAEAPAEEPAAEAPAVERARSRRARSRRARCRRACSRRARSPAEEPAAEEPAAEEPQAEEPAAEEPAAEEPEEATAEEPAAEEPAAEEKTKGKS